VESAKTSQPAGAKAQPQKKKLSAKEILADIREGMSDQAFEQKYHLTRAGRENLFKQLIAKGLMSEAELQWRSKLLKSQEASNVVPAPQEPRSDPPTETPGLIADPPPQAHRADISKEKLNGIAKSFQMLVNRGVITAEESSEVINGIEIGTISYEYASNLLQEFGEKPPTLSESPLTSESKGGSIASKFRDGSWIEEKKILVLVLIFASPLGLYGLWKTSRFPILTKIIVAIITVILVALLNIFAIYVWIIAGVAALSYVLLGRFKGAKQRVTKVAETARETMPKAQEALKGAKERITQVASPLRGQKTAVPDQSKAAAIQATRSSEPVSAEEVKKALEILEKARRDLVGIFGDIGILAVGGGGGAIAAGTIAAFFGATSIWGLTTAGAFVGLSIAGKTPWLFFIGCAIGGAALAFGVSRLVKNSAKAMTNRKWTIEQLREQVKKREEDARKAKVGKTQMVKLIECLQMLLSNQEKTGITPEECEALIEGVKSGKITYEVAFASVEDYLKDLKEE